MIIERPEEARKIQEIRKWILIYGRRKTGKTFLVRNFITYDEYYFVKGNRNILTNKNESLNSDAFIPLLKKDLETNKTVVIDEFQRLGNEFFDFLHFSHKQGKLILISSTLFLSKNLISSKSPLLGLFAEIPIELISLSDALRALSKFALPKKEKLELAVLLREPIAIDFFDEKKNARDTIASIVLMSLQAIPALIGEIFTEEARELSAVYEGILRAVASGKVSSGEISSHLFSRHLIKKDDPSILQQYLTNLIAFGILKRIDIFGKKRYAYKIISPLARIYYYTDEKYNLSERRVSKPELLRIINEILPRIIEDTVREALAIKEGLRESIMETKDFDIDGCLLKFDKPNIALEVKWKSTIDSDDIFKARKNLERIASRKRYLFIPDKTGIKSDVDLLDVDDLL